MSGYRVERILFEGALYKSRCVPLVMVVLSFSIRTPGRPSTICWRHQPLRRQTATGALEGRGDEVAQTRPDQQFGVFE